MRGAAKEIKAKRDLIVFEHRLKKTTKSAAIPQKYKARNQTLDQLEDQVEELGISADVNRIRARSQSRCARKRDRSESRAVSTMRDASVSNLSKRVKVGGALISKSQVRDRSVMGVKDVTEKRVSEKIKHKGERQTNLEARAGEADRVILTKMPKHLFAGKRKMGKTDRR